ncbi:MAG: Crp/Fnr family transcriptional regulator [Bacteroidales bacterium]|nr:Crp/Fnr family transcriptional regulator [Bacteroidales bacterium]
MKETDEKCNCEGCELKSLFFSNIEAYEIERICRIKIEKSFKKGEIILKEGDEITNFIYLKSGMVKLHRNLSTKKDQIINITKLFDFISLFSVFSETKYNYSVSAIEDSVTCNIKLSEIRKLILENGKFALDLIQKMSKNTDRIILQSLELKQRNLNGRVAFILLYFAKEIYNNLVFDLPVSRKEIGEYINMSTENVIRTFSEFRKDKIINIFGKTIEIIDLKNLEQISLLG